MYIHLGQETVVKKRDIIGIFDLDNTTVSAKTRNFLKQAEKKGQVINVSFDLPKSFVICKSKNNECKVYITPISSSTLLKRSEFII